MSYLGSRGGLTRLEKPVFFNSTKTIAETPTDAPQDAFKLDHKNLLVLVRQMHLDRHPRPSTIIPQLQSMTVRDRPARLAAGTEGHDRRVVVVLQFYN